MTNDERDTLINSILPDTVKGQQRPAENLNPDMPYSTDFPQLISKDPASADVFNLINRQLLSNDKYIKALLESGDNHALAIATDFSTINGKPTTEDRTSCVVIRDNANSAYRQAIAIQSERPTNNNIARIVADAGNNCIRFNLYNPTHDTDISPYLNGCEFRFNRDGDISYVDYEGDGTNNYILGAREISRQFGETGYIKYANGIVVQWIRKRGQRKAGDGSFDDVYPLPITIKKILNIQTTLGDMYDSAWLLTRLFPMSDDFEFDENKTTSIQVRYNADSKLDSEADLLFSCFIIGLWK